MNTKTILAITGVALGLGTIGYFLFKSSSTAGSNNLTPSTNPSGTNVLDVFNSVKNLVSSNNEDPRVKYENKLIRIDKGKVYLVVNGLMRYVSKLPLPDGRTWPVDYELKTAPLPEGTPLNGLSQFNSSLLQ